MQSAASIYVMSEGRTNPALFRIIPTSIAIDAASTFSWVCTCKTGLGLPSDSCGAERRLPKRIGRFQSLDRRTYSLHVQTRRDPILQLALGDFTAKDEV